MGQRSQIYVKFEIPDGSHNLLIANYYQWNYGSRMISRIRHFIEYIQSMKDSLYSDGGMHYWYDSKETQNKLRRLLDVNFDMQDIVISHDIIQEFNDYSNAGSFNEYVFWGQDNNDGQCYLIVHDDGTVKYCLTDYDLTDRLTPQEYMKDYNDEDTEVLNDNMKYIVEHAQMMSNAEWAEFVNGDYSDLIRPSNEKQTREYQYASVWANMLQSKRTYQKVPIGAFLSKYSDEEAARFIRNWAVYRTDLTPKQFMLDQIHKLILERKECQYE